MRDLVRSMRRLTARNRNPQPTCGRCGKIVVPGPTGQWVEIFTRDTACGFTAQGIEFDHQPILVPHQ